MNVSIRGNSDSANVVLLVTLTPREVEALQELARKPLPKVLAITHPAYDVLVKPQYALWADTDDGTVVIGIGEEWPAVEEDRSHRTSKQAEGK